MSLFRLELERMSDASTRRDFKMRGGSNTVRHLSTLGGRVINKLSSLIPALYYDTDLIKFLSGLAGEEIYTVPDPIENYVVNILHEKNDTHGAHIDTYAYAFIIAIVTPDEDSGGMVELVPHSKNAIDLEGPRVKSIPLSPGDCYFLRSDLAVHRVSTMKKNSKRIVINFAYANQQTVELQSYSSSLLYDEENV